MKNVYVGTLVTFMGLICKWLHGIPFIFTISKFDKIDDNQESIDKVHSNIKESFPNFFHTNSKAIISSIAPVSLGNNIDGAETDKAKGKYAPKNILFPFIFSLGVSLLNKSYSLCSHKNISEELVNTAMNEYNKNKNSLNDLISNPFSLIWKYGILLQFGYSIEKNTLEREMLHNKEKLDKENSKLKNINSEIIELKLLARTLIDSVNTNESSINTRAFII